MSANLLKTLGEIAGIGGITLGIFFLVLRGIIKKDIFPQLAKNQAFKILSKMITFAFVLAVLGIGSWLFSDFFKTSNQTQLAKEFSKVIIEDGKIIAEKEDGKIIALDRGSCIGNSPFLNLDGTPSKMHKISVELINLFDRPVSILEHHVMSRIDGQEIMGYKYKVDSLFALKPSSNIRLDITANLMTERIWEHISKFDSEEYGVTQEVIFVTSEGVLPPIPVRGISSPCGD